MKVSIEHEIFTNGNFCGKEGESCPAEFEIESRCSSSYLCRIFDDYLSQTLRTKEYPYPRSLRCKKCLEIVG